MRLIDDLLGKFVAREKRYLDQEKYDRLHPSYDETSDVSEEELHLYYLDIIDGKAAALLQHISIMAAVGMLLLDKVHYMPLKIMIGLEVFFYIIAACLCLRCIRIIGPHLQIDSKADFKKQLAKAVVFRRELYRFALNSVTVITIGLAASLVLHGIGALIIPSMRAS